MPRKTTNGAEVDVVYARRHYCYLQRAGATSWWKRNMRRRERREGKADTAHRLKEITE